MKLMLATLSVFALSLSISAQNAGQSGLKGLLLENLTWIEAEKILTPSTIVVIPLGAAAKEHGPHLKLKNDLLIAEYLKGRVLREANVVIAPTINYHFYPAFIEYPGSTSLRLETARDLMVDICRSLARFGPRRFYVLNTGISTLRALKLSADLLSAEGIHLRYTNLNLLEPIEKTIGKQEGGTHADEIETSIMLYITPSEVEMRKAVKDFHPSRGRGLTRDPKGEGTYSATGIWGDPTLATRAKGQQLTEFLVTAILREIEDLRKVP